MKPDVTIGMCLHNSEAFLKNALASITQQIFPHERMEVILVDDGSQDNTLKIAQNFASTSDIPTKVFSFPWKGLGFARNLVVTNAEGIYILWVDADEILTPNYVKTQVEFMEKNPDVGISPGLLQLVQNNLVLNLELIPAIITQKIQQRNKPKDYIWQTDKMPGTGGTIFRAKVLNEVNGFNSQLTGACEDQEVAQRIQKAGWRIQANDARFYEMHGGMSTFLHLWKKYLWYGYGSEQLYRKNQTIFSLPRMSPLAGFVTGILYARIAYKLMYRKEVFILPFHYGTKMIAWMLGFVKRQVYYKRH